MYIILLILFIILDYKLDGSSIHTALSFIMTIGIVSLVCFVIQRINLKVDAALSSEYVEEDETFMMSLISRCRFPYTVLQPEIKIRNLQTKVTETDMKINDIIFGSKSDYKLNFKEIGNVLITVKDVKFKSLFSIMNGEKKINKELEVLIYPHPQSYDEEEIEHRYLSGETDYINQKGNDVSEVYNVRPYVKGDDLRHIHHSISHKKGEDYVRVGTQTRTKINVYPYKKKENFSECVNQTAKIISMFQDHKNDNFFIARESELIQLCNENDLFEFIKNAYKEFIIYDND